MTDRSLMEKTVRGDSEAFKVLIKRYQNVVYHSALRFFPDPDDAEEVAQEVFVRFYFSLSRFRFKSSLGFYLLRLARNLCIDWKRKQKQEAIAIKESVDRRDLQSDHHHPFGLLDAVRRLPPKQRCVIERAYLEGYKLEEISRGSNIALGTVKSRLGRGLKALRKSFADRMSARSEALSHQAQTISLERSGRTLSSYEVGRVRPRRLDHRKLYSGG